MNRSNLIPITRIYDIYPKYTYSDNVKKFMDEIVDIDRANVYTKDEVVAMLEELQKEVDELYINNPLAEDEEDINRGIEKAVDVIQQKINYWRKKK